MTRVSPIAELLGIVTCDMEESVWESIWKELRWTLQQTRRIEEFFTFYSSLPEPSGSQTFPQAINYSVSAICTTSFSQPTSKVAANALSDDQISANLLENFFGRHCVTVSQKNEPVTTLTTLTEAFNGTSTMNCQDFLRFCGLTDIETHHDIFRPLGQFRLALIHRRYDLGLKGFLDESDYGKLKLDICRYHHRLSLSRHDDVCHVPSLKEVLYQLKDSSNAQPNQLNFEQFLEAVNRKVIEGTSKLMRLYLFPPKSDQEYPKNVPIENQRNFGFSNYFLNSSMPISKQKVERYDERKSSHHIEERSIIQRPHKIDQSLSPCKKSSSYKIRTDSRQISFFEDSTILQNILNSLKSKFTPKKSPAATKPISKHSVDVNAPFSLPLFSCVDAVATADEYINQLEMTVPRLNCLNSQISYQTKCRPAVVPQLRLANLTTTSKGPLCPQKDAVGASSSIKKDSNKSSCNQLDIISTHAQKHSSNQLNLDVPALSCSHADRTHTINTKLAESILSKSPHSFEFDNQKECTLELSKSPHPTTPARDLSIIPHRDSIAATLYRQTPPTYSAQHRYSKPSLLINPAKSHSRIWNPYLFVPSLRPAQPLVDVRTPLRPPRPRVAPVTQSSRPSLRNDEIPLGNDGIQIFQTLQSDEINGSFIELSEQVVYRQRTLSDLVERSQAFETQDDGMLKSCSDSEQELRPKLIRSCRVSQIESKSCLICQKTPTTSKTQPNIDKEYNTLDDGKGETTLLPEYNDLQTLSINHKVIKEASQQLSLSPIDSPVESSIIFEENLKAEVKRPNHIPYTSMDPDLPTLSTKDSVQSYKNEEITTTNNNFRNEIDMNLNSVRLNKNETSSYEKPKMEDIKSAAQTSQSSSNNTFENFLLVHSSWALAYQNHPEKKNSKNEIDHTLLNLACDFSKDEIESTSIDLLKKSISKLYNIYHAFRYQTISTDHENSKKTISLDELLDTLAGHISDIICNTKLNTSLSYEAGSWHVLHQQLTLILWHVVAVVYFIQGCTREVDNHSPEEEMSQFKKEITQKLMNSIKTSPIYIVPSQSDCVITNQCPPLWSKAELSTRQYTDVHSPISNAVVCRRLSRASYNIKRADSSYYTKSAGDEYGFDQGEKEILLQAFCELFCTSLIQLQKEREEIEQLSKKQGMSRSKRAGFYISEDAAAYGVFDHGAHPSHPSTSN